MNHAHSIHFVHPQAEGASTRRVLVWSHTHQADKVYSRDRVVYRLLERIGAQLAFFRPGISALGDLEARLRGLPAADAVWVPSFRQRDVAAAARFCRRLGIPLIFDPLISAYDKQVNERAKFAASSRAAQKLLKHEQALFGQAAIVIADTVGHASYFTEVLGVAPERIVVLPVGADESLFLPTPATPRTPGPRRVLFFGSFIGLHGIPTVVEAIRRYTGPPVAFELLGAGPERAAAEAQLGGLATPGVQVRFHDWLAIEQLGARIASADVVLGIFGTSGKALRVVPNKVYQALAVGRPVITADTPAFDVRFRAGDAHAPLALTPPGDPDALARQLAGWLAEDDATLAARGASARALFEDHFSEDRLAQALLQALAARDWGRNWGRDWGGTP